MLLHGGDVTGYELEYNKKPIDFSANINPLGVPEGVKKAIINSISNINMYPDPLCRKLIDEISNFENIDKKNIICGNGAADLIFSFVFALKPKKAIIPIPTFAEYEQALNSINCEIDYYYMKSENNFKIDETILDKLIDEIDVIFICNPNNPTGEIIEKKLLEKIVYRCKEKNIFVVLDECFNSFLDKSEEFTMKDKLYNDNLFILKAFTKLYAMAGVRLGYAFLNNNVLIEKINQIRQPWSVSSVAQEAGISALKEIEYVKKTKKIIKTERDFLISQLKNLDADVIGSKANYIFFKFDDRELDKKFRKKGILIRSCGNYKGLDNTYYRIAVKNHEENTIFIKNFDEIKRGL